MNSHHNLICYFFFLLGANSHIFLKIGSLIVPPRFFSTAHHLREICFARPSYQLWAFHTLLLKKDNSNSRFHLFRRQISSRLKTIWCCWPTVMYVSVLVQISNVLSSQISPKSCQCCLLGQLQCFWGPEWVSFSLLFGINYSRSFGLHSRTEHLFSVKWKSDSSRPSQHITLCTEGRSVFRRGYKSHWSCLCYAFHCQTISGSFYVWRTG